MKSLSIFENFVEYNRLLIYLTLLDYLCDFKTFQALLKVDCHAMIYLKYFKPVK